MIQHKNFIFKNSSLFIFFFFSVILVTKNKIGYKTFKIHINNWGLMKSRFNQMRERLKVF